MLRGIRLSADELHSIRVVDLDYYRPNPFPAGPVFPQEIVGAHSMEEMRGIEYDIFGEEIL